MMAMKMLLFLLLLLATGECGLHSVPELERVMYKAIDGKPCIRLLNLYGESGCANAGRSKVVAPVHRLEALEIKSSEPVTVLLPYSLFHIFLEKTALEPAFASKVAGVLLEYERNSSLTANTSPDEKFPQAEFAIYSDKSYQWNPWGAGVIHKRYDFPVYLLTEESTKLLQEVAARNQERNTDYPVHVAEFDVVMQTTKSGTHTTESCLNEWSCLPLGGYSVLSALPSSTRSPKPVLLVMATMDSASFFRDATPGADSHLSGLIALLGAVDALSRTGTFSKMKNKQVVFLLNNGEAWSYLGSRRFLHELENGGESVAGLNASNIYQVLELGSVGGLSKNVLYAHSNQENHASSPTNEILSALNHSSEGLQVQVRAASKQNPGIPPSSLMTFLQKNSSLAGVVLEDFDTSFTNKFYHSHLDTTDNVDIAAVVAASTIVARTIHQLVNNDSTIKASELASINANSSLVSELRSCLLSENPGMQCELVKSLITPTQPAANHYVGVFLGDPSSPALPENLDDKTRFIWNFMADRTKASGSSSSSSSCTVSCEDSSQVCVGATLEHNGSCVVSSTRYVPAYSTRLEYKSGSWKLLPAAEGDLMGSIDPVWAESFWKTLGLRVFLQDDPSFDRLILLAGFCITMASSLAIVVTRAFFKKRLKSA